MTLVILKIMKKIALYSTLIFFISSLTCSCSLLIRKQYKKDKSGAIHIKDLDSSWKIERDGDTNYIFKNKSSQALFYLDSVCHKYQEIPLDYLKEKIFKNIKVSHSVDQKIFYNDREGVYNLSEGTLDGVPVFLEVLIIKKNHCLYDLIMIENKKKEQISQELFFQLKNSIIF